VNILVSGASGLIGSALVPQLEAAGHAVRRLVRHTPNSALEVPWPANHIDPTALQLFDAVFHLAGRNIGARWTSSVKREIRESRVHGTQAIASAAAHAFRSSGNPSVLISVSAVGYYGSRGDEDLSETSGSGSGFLAEVCRDWEAATAQASEAGVRVVIPRIGVVLTKRGGALKKMLLPFQSGLGGPIGNGRQWMSWIVLEDLVRILASALNDQRMRGPINAVAPQPVTNREFTKALGSALHRPTLFPLPAFAVKTIFGAMGKETLLASGRVLPRKLQELGFAFRHPEIGEAIQFAIQH
jgi:uncharacterized protein (TIGR01777 family)